MIRPIKPSDAEKISTIYNYYITDTVISFEEDTITPAEMESRFTEISTRNLPWLVAEDDDGQLKGYAYASPWKGRSAYRFCVEVTVYVSHLATAEGWGTKLYRALFSELKKQSVHTVIGGIALPNPASIALHEKFSMEKVAHFHEVGFKFNQ